MHSRRYAGCKEHELWGYLPAASGRSFQAFRDEVMALYPGSDDDRRYSDKDLRRLVIDQQTHSITTRADLGAYYREFLRISDFLVKKGRMSSLERNRLYMEGFNRTLRTRILTRLEVQHPDHYPDDPYDISTFHQCAHFLLAGTAAAPTIGQVSQQRSPPSGPSTTTATPTPATETTIQRMTTYLQQRMDDLTQQLDARLQARFNTAPTPSMTVYKQSTPSEKRCYFDGCPCAIRECPAVAEYLAQGRCL